MTDAFKERFPAVEYRPIVGVDRGKALELYSKYLNDSPLNSEQEEYVKCVLD